MIHVETQGAVDVIALEAPLDREHVDLLAKKIDEAAAGGQPLVVIDLGRTPLVDGAGLECLLDAHDRIRERGGAIKLAAANPLCSDILRASGVDLRFEIFATAKTAVGSFAG